MMGSTHLKVGGVSRYGYMDQSCTMRTRLLLLALIWLILHAGIAMPNKPPKHTPTTNVTIGVILPYKGTYLWTFYPFTKYALHYAIEGVKSRGILPHHDLILNPADSQCSDILGPLFAIDMYVNKSADVFFGPACDYAVAPVARFSPYWNIPVITSGAMVNAFDDKNQYQLLTRIGGTYYDLNNVIRTVTDNFNWKKLGMMYEDNLVEPKKGKTDYFFVLEAIYVGFTQRHGEDSIYHNSFDRAGNSTQYYDLRKNLEEISLTSRIVVLCASPDAVRDIMLKAKELGFVNGEYVFFNIDLFSSKTQIQRPWYRENDTKAQNDEAKEAYEALMTVTLRKPDSDEYKIFSEEVKKRAKQAHGNLVYGEEEVNSFVGAFHDAVILYALALNQTLEAGYNASNGTEITKHMWNTTFTGITGTVSIDANGDRNADYSLLDQDPDTGEFQVVADYFGNKQEYEPAPGKDIYWVDKVTKAPADTPECGFDGTGCPPNKPFPGYAIVIIVLGSMLLLVSMAAFFVYRHYRLEYQLREVNWRVRWDDIMFGALEKRKLERSGSRHSLRRMSYHSNISGDTIAVHLSDMGNKQVFTKTGYYKATLVAIKKIHKNSINIAKPLLMEFKRMRDLQNDHIVRFIGTCIDAPNQCILTEYCPKGSLQDVLENDQFKLDSMFKFSLMQDIVRGMTYLHGSELRSHGNLKSSNCVVDSRFVLKITDFGLNQLRGRNEQSEEDIYVYYRSRLWTAPELLRLQNPPPAGTQKGDVYSFAIICQEIVYRNGPFWLGSAEPQPQEIYRKTKDGERPYFRPLLLDPVDDDDACSEDVANMIKKCWSEDPTDRPDFHALKGIIRKFNKEGDSGNILDNLLSRMEQHANNLEALVEERTADYLEQKKRAEDLLYLMLPRSVAGQLMRGESVTAEKFESVTIYFSDICGFTSLSAESTPMQVVDMLNDLYTTFDSIITTYDVYKVETIGDAYMVVSGLPQRNGELHAREVSRMALALLNAVVSFKVRHKPNHQLKLRIGIHSDDTGGVCAGVVGQKMPRYCLFGDTVNTASRMESNGEPLKIHVSANTKRILDQFGTFHLKCRGDIEIKGKGKMTTYWLLGETNPEHPDFAPRESILA